MLRGAVDQDRRRMGRFLLLGSVSPRLMTQVSESLAGRLSLVELTPLTLPELSRNEQRRRRWLFGGFPDGGMLAGRGYPVWQQDYLSLLVQRDLPNWGSPASAAIMDRLLHMLAAVHGQEWNAAQVGKSLALSYHTVNNYVDYLEGAFLIRRLPAFHANIRKRMVKRPKLYWRDTGLLHALLNVGDERALLNAPWVGASWEGFVIEQTLAALDLADRQCQAFHMRTSDQWEIDLVLDISGEIWALEIKLTATPRQADLTRLNRAADLIGADRRFLVCCEADLMDDGTRVVCDLDGLLGLLSQ